MSTVSVCNLPVFFTCHAQTPLGNPQNPERSPRPFQKVPAGLCADYTITKLAALKSLHYTILHNIYLNSALYKNILQHIKLLNPWLLNATLDYSTTFRIALHYSALHYAILHYITLFYSVIQQSTYSIQKSALHSSILRNFT